MGGNIYIVGKNEAECLGFLRQRKLDFIRGVTILVTNGNYRSQLGRLFERQDKVVILRGADEHLIDIVHANAAKSGITLGGSL